MSTSAVAPSCFNRCRAVVEAGRAGPDDGDAQRFVIEADHERAGKGRGSRDPFIRARSPRPARRRGRPRPSIRSGEAGDLETLAGEGGEVAETLDLRVGQIGSDGPPRRPRAGRTVSPSSACRWSGASHPPGVDSHPPGHLGRRASAWPPRSLPTERDVLRLAIELVPAGANENDVEWFSSGGRRLLMSASERTPPSSRSVASTITPGA